MYLKKKKKTELQKKRGRMKNTITYLLTETKFMNTNGISENNL